MLSTIYDTATPFNFADIGEFEDYDEATGDYNAEEDPPEDVPKRPAGKRGQEDADCEASDGNFARKPDRLSVDARSNVNRQVSAMMDAAEAQMREEGHYEAPTSEAAG
ncbi:hypothetical protein ACOMHN_035313 [Nucella lapillus]